MLRIGPLEPVTAGDNTATLDNTTDASDPCRPQAAGLSDYKGPTGCYLSQPRPGGSPTVPGAPPSVPPNPPFIDPNCFSPNQVAVGLLYATTEECRPNAAPQPASPGSTQPAEPLPHPGPGDYCRSTVGTIDLQGKNAEPVLDGDGVKARAGVADLFLTDGSKPVPNFLHLSAINSFAEVTCRPFGPGGSRVPVFDARSQVVYLAGSAGGNLVGVDLIPGLIPNLSPTVFNRYGEIGPIRFNATYINNNESGGPVGPDEGQPRKPDPTTGDLNLNGDADPSTPAFEPITKVTQRAVDIAGAIVAGEATVNVTKAPCAPGPVVQNGTIKVNKVTTPAGDTTRFGFTDQAGGRFDMAGGESRTTPPLPPGTYTITEDDSPNYTESVACADPSGNSTTAGRTATIVLAANEQVVCTFTNARNKCPDGKPIPPDGKCDKVCPNGKPVPPNGKCHKRPPKCDRDGDGRDDHDRDRDGRDDRDRDDDGRDDRNGKHLKRTDRNRDGRDDECERDRKERKRCNDRHRKANNDGHKDDDKGRRKGDRDDDDKGRHKGDRDDDDKGCKHKRSKKSKK